MTTVAIVCEYNPFHNGHLYQIEKVREHFGADTAIIAIMSGNFVQRGEIAILDKWKRAEAACIAGVDLVLELPFPYSMSSAEFFASAAVHIAVKAGAKVLSFGSECGDVELLKKAATNMSKPEYTDKIKSFGGASNKKSLGYPAICELAYKELFGEAEAIAFTPNNILGVEYIKASMRYDNPLKLHTITRHGAGYSEENIVSGELQSATAIRKIFESNTNSALKYIPLSTHNTILSASNNKEFPTDAERLAPAVLTHFRLSDPTVNCEVHDAAGGLYNRLISKSFEATSISSLTELCATKKYTAARIRRAIWFSLFGVTSSDLRELPEYSQLLACDTVGQLLLKRIKKVSGFQVLTKPSATDGLSQKAMRQKLLSDKADSLFAIARPVKTPGNASLKATPYVKKQ